MLPKLKTWSAGFYRLSNFVICFKEVTMFGGGIQVGNMSVQSNDITHPFRAKFKL
jgi:hypothetical protein